jgi:hypothetical protein
MLERQKRLHTLEEIRNYVAETLGRLEKPEPYQHPLPSRFYIARISLAELSSACMGLGQSNSLPFGRPNETPLSSTARGASA